MNKLMKYMLITLLISSGIGSVLAQNSETNYQDSMIVVPKDMFLEVVSNAIIERKKTINTDSLKLRIRLLKAQLAAQKNQLAVNTSNIQQSGALNAGTNEFDGKSRQQLENQIRELMLQLASQRANNSDIVLQGSKNGTTDEHSQWLNKMATPGGQSLTNITTPDSTTKTVDTVIVDNTALEKELARLVEETNRLRDRIKNNQQEKVAKSQYAGIIKEVFFGNNKINLSSEAISTIDYVVSILKSDSQLEIMVKGFASKTGNSVYNNDLSLKRSDNVKKAFIAKGIAPGRVMTTYHGEDFSNRSEAESRRVDIIILDTRR